VHRRDQVQQEQLGQLLGVHAIVLTLRAVDQPQLARMRHRHVSRQRPQFLVELAVAAGGLVADREGLVQLPQMIRDGRSRSFELNLIDRAAAGVENAQRRLTRVNIESDVEHASLRFGFEATCHKHADLALA
jgi:hypothetical protein